MDLIALVLTTVATVVLLDSMREIRFLAAVAVAATTSGDELRALPSTLVRSVGGMVVLLVILVLNVYKPQGMTRYGWRQQQTQRTQREPRPSAPVP